MGDQGSLFDLELGERAKNLGQLQAGAADRAWAWRQQAEATIWDLASSGVPFTADDVIRLVGLPSYGTNRNNAVGAIFTACAKRGWITKTGSYRKARRSASHARMLAVWVGAEEL
jgi:hypothetical protein